MFRSLITVMVQRANSPAERIPVNRAVPRVHLVALRGFANHARGRLIPAAKVIPLPVREVEKIEQKKLKNFIDICSL